MLEGRVKDRTKNWKLQAIEEARKIGWQEVRQEGETELLLNLLEWRLDLIDESVRAYVKSTDMQTLLVSGRSILSAQSIEEVFKH